MNKYLFWECLCKIIFFVGAKTCHAIMSCNTDQTTLFFAIYDLWYHEFVMLKPTLKACVHYFLSNFYFFTKW